MRIRLKGKNVKKNHCISCAGKNSEKKQTSCIIEMNVLWRHFSADIVGVGNNDRTFHTQMVDLEAGWNLNVITQEQQAVWRTPDDISRETQWDANQSSQRDKKNWQMVTTLPLVLNHRAAHLRVHQIMQRRQDRTVFTITHSYRKSRKSLPKETLTC